MLNNSVFYLRQTWEPGFLQRVKRIHTQKRVGEGARIVIEDGNGQTLSYQGLDYTDFPMDEITLFASWSGEFWVAMLPSEY